MTTHWPWTSKAEALLTKLRSENVSVSQIAKQLRSRGFCVTLDSVTNKVRRMDLPRSPVTVWPVEAEILLESLYADGFSYADVAKLLCALGFKTTRNAVGGKVHRLGVKDLREPAPVGMRARFEPKLIKAVGMGR